MYCPKCGTQNMDTAIQCASCAAMIQPPPPPRRIEDIAGMRMLLPIGRSAYAIAAGYVALISIAVIPLAPVALVLAILAMRDMKRNPDRHGKGRAWFALVVGVLWTILLLWIVVMIFVLPHLKHGA